MRNYIWDFEVIENLANLEIDCYQALPDISKVKIDLDKLKSTIREIFNKDENLKSAFDNLFDYIDSDNDVYTKIDRVKEVINV